MEIIPQEIASILNKFNQNLEFSSSSIIQCLESHKLEVTERFKLAQFVFSDNQYYIVNKNKFFLDWTINLIFYIYGNKISSSITFSLNDHIQFWNFLLNILESIEACFIRGNLLVFFANSILLSSKNIKEGSSFEKLLLIKEKILHLLLNKFSEKFRPSLEDYFQFLKKNLESLFNINGSFYSSISILVNFVIEGIYLFQSLQRQQTNLKKGFGFTLNLLEPLFQAYSILKSHCSNHQINEISQVFIQSIQSLLSESSFHASHLQHFVQSLNSEEILEERKKQKTESGSIDKSHITNFKLQLFDKLKYLLQTFFSQDEERIQVACIFPSLFLNFIRSMSDKKILSKMKQTLSSSSSNSLKRKEPSTDSSAHLIQFHFFLDLFELIQPFFSQSKYSLYLQSSMLQTLNHILQIFFEHHVYQLVGDRDKVQGKFFLDLKNVLLNLLQTGKLDSQLIETIFQTLWKLGQINHLFLEPSLKDIFVLLFEHSQTISSSEFSSNIFRLYSKLRQVDKLIKILFEALRTSSIVVPFFGSEQFISQFVESTQLLPVGQVTVIWEQFLTESSTYLATLFSFEPVSSISKSSSLDHFIQIFTLFVDHLIVNKSVSHELEELTEKTFQSFIAPVFFEIPNNYNSSTLSNFLFLFHSLLTLEQNCHQFSQSGDSSKLTQWNDYLTQVLSSFKNRGQDFGINTKYIFNLLRIRRIQILHFERDLSFKEESSNLINALLEEVTNIPSCDCQEINFPMSKGSLTDILLEKKLVSMHTKIYYLMFWKLIIESLPFFTNASDKFISNILQLIISPCKCMTEVHQPLATLGYFSKSILVNSSFYEIKFVRDNMMKVFLSEIFSFFINDIKLSKTSPLFRLLTLLIQENRSPKNISLLQQYPDIKPLFQTKFNQSVISNLIELENISTVSENKLNRIGWILQLTACFPRTYFTTEEKIKCFVIVLILEAISYQYSHIPKYKLEALKQFFYSRNLLCVLLEQFTNESIYIICEDLFLWLLQTIPIYENFMKSSEIPNFQPIYFKYFLTSPTDNISLSSLVDILIQNFKESKSEVILSCLINLIGTIRFLLKEKEIESKKLKQEFSVPQQWKELVGRIENSIFEEVTETYDIKYIELFAHLLDFYRITIMTRSGNLTSPILSMIGTHLNLISTTLNNKDISPSLKQQSFGYLKVFCDSLPYYASFDLKKFSFTLAYFISLLNSHFSNSEYFQSLLKAFQILVSRIYDDQLHLLLKTLKSELSHSNIQRVEVAICATDCLLKYGKSFKSKQISSLNRPTMALLLKLLNCAKNTLLSTNSIITVLDIIHSLIENIFFPLSQRDISLLLHSVGLFYNRACNTEELFNKFYILLYSMLRHKPKELYPSISTFLCGVKILLDSVSNANYKLPLLCSQNLGRLYEEISKHQSFKKYIVYIIADFIQLLQNQALADEIKKCILPGIFSIFDICSEHEFSQLFRVLDGQGKALFKSLHSQYQTDFKFTGKT